MLDRCSGTAPCTCVRRSPRKIMDRLFSLPCVRRNARQIFKWTLGSPTEISKFILLLHVFGLTPKTVKVSKTLVLTIQNQISPKTGFPHFGQKTTFPTKILSTFQAIMFSNILVSNVAPILGPKNFFRTSGPKLLVALPMGIPIGNTTRLCLCSRQPPITVHT